MKIPANLIPILTLIEPTKDWEKMTIEMWVHHLIVANQSTIKYLPMRMLDGDQTDRILRQFPEKANEGNVNWDKLSGADWSCLLHTQPQFSVHCDWEKVSGIDWTLLLQKQPQFAIYRNKRYEQYK